MLHKEAQIGSHASLEKVKANSITELEHSLITQMSSLPNSIPFLPWTMHNELIPTDEFTSYNTCSRLPKV